jgi:DNA mismatch endonuclease (patch repair protein)
MPELALRSLLHSRGLRFRVDHPIPALRRRADVVFTRARVAVFVDGCFWHDCPEHGTTPQANAAWWTEKIAANRARDHDTDRTLTQSGWTSIRIWEHEDAEDAARKVEAIVRQHLTRRQKSETAAPRRRLRTRSN